MKNTVYLLQISALVLEIFKLEKSVKYADERTDDVMHTLNQVLHQVNILSYLSQFEAESIETLEKNYQKKKMKICGLVLRTTHLRL